MCNIVPIVLNIQRIFEYFVLFSIIKQIHSKSVRKYDECEQFFDAHDCYYFPCLDAHYSCGVDSHLARFSYDLCLLTTKKYSSQLTVNGKFYFNHTNQCAMASLHDQLIEENISAKFTCTHLQTMVFNIYIKCFQSTQPENQMATIIDFCSIICENLQVMIDLFLNLNNMYINLHQLLIRTGKACGAEVNENVLHTVPSLLMSICLDRKNVRLKEDITNIMFNQRFEPSDYEWI
jgi:hypothetical protein